MTEQFQPQPYQKTIADLCDLLIPHTVLTVARPRVRQPAPPSIGFGSGYEWVDVPFDGDWAGACELQAIAEEALFPPDPEAAFAWRALQHFDRLEVVEICVAMERASSRRSSAKLRASVES